MDKCTPLIILVCISLASFSQSPGGVSANLRGWYDGSSGVTLASSAVSQWNDRSGNAFNGTQTTASSRPVASSLINYNTVLTFDGTNDFLNIPDLVASTSTGLTVFAVARQTSTSNDPVGCILVGQTNNIGASGGYGLTSQSLFNTSFGFFVRDYGVNTVGYNTTLSETAVMTGNWNGTTANNLEYFQDGTSRDTDPYTPGSVGDNGNSYIGSGIGSGTDYCFSGHIAEIAVYSTGLSAANVNKVESYLALKYGVTLSTNYVTSAGTTVFSNASPYNNDIMGIGRDDGSGLIQKQSQNTDDSVRVFLSTLAASNSANGGSFSSNHQYLVTGANTGKLRGTTLEKPAGVYSRIEREWKIVNTGFNGSFSFSMKLSAGGAPGSVNTAHLRLLVGDDGDFSDATVINSGVSFSYSNPLITVSGIDNTIIAANSTKYITIASAVASTPLPIELVNFFAELCNNQVCLKWKTASEMNNDRFELERSPDAVNWEKVGTVKGLGTRAQGTDYEYKDEFPLKGISYYRLRQVDADGTESITPLVFVNNSLPVTEIRIYPSPANEMFFTEGLSFNSLVRIFDESGREVTGNIQLKDGEPPSVICAGLQNGSYILQISDAAGYVRQTCRILVQR